MVVFRGVSWSEVILQSDISAPGIDDLLIDPTFPDPYPIYGFQPTLHSTSSKRVY
jgi:hypothetical protein